MKPRCKEIHAVMVKMGEFIIIFIITIIIIKILYIELSNEDCLDII